MKVHSRTFLVQTAEAEISSTLLDLQQKHDLTTVEYLQILNRVQASTLKYALRSERHPDDPEKRGDEE